MDRRNAWTADAVGVTALGPDGSGGSLLRLVQGVGATILAPALDGDGTIAVHGDFGPQNMLFDARGRVVALLDWEFAHMGDAVEDLAWAEWIVRMHHADAIDALDELFIAHGMRPPWPARHEAMSSNASESGIAAGPREVPWCARGVRQAG